MRNVSKNVLYVLFVFSAVACFASEEVETASCGEEKTVSAIKEMRDVITSPSDELYDLAAIDFRGLSKSERDLHIVIARRRLEFLQARKNFRECLFNSSADSERNHFNCPSHCTELAREFIRLRGKHQMIEMIQDFNEYWN